MGVGKGDRVALIMPNCPQYVIAFYATARLGAIVVGNNPLYTTREMEHQLRDCPPRRSRSCSTCCTRTSWTCSRPWGKHHVLVARLNDYMSFPKKQLAPALKFTKAQREQGKPWPPVAKGAPVTWWEGWLDAAGPAPAAPLIDPGDRHGRVHLHGRHHRASKGAMLSHRNMVANAMQAAAYLSFVEGEEVLLARSRTSTRSGC